jgi:hypothetical protein
MALAKSQRKLGHKLIGMTISYLPSLFNINCLCGAAGPVCVTFGLNIEIPNSPGIRKRKIDRQIGKILIVEIFIIFHLIRPR